VDSGPYRPVSLLASYRSYPLKREDLIQSIRRVLEADDTVCFAYLYGSCARAEAFQDIDIAVGTTRQVDPLTFGPEMKNRLSAETGLPQDTFDVRVIDDLIRKGDLFSLVFLREILGNGILLADKDFDRRAQFIEEYGLKYLENQGLLGEVLL
jgi:predicted nucleotidyltransferase